MKNGLRQTRTTNVLAMFGIVASLGAISLAVPASADWPQEHPHYLHALSDLKQARAWLGQIDDEEVMADERDAMHEIDEAIGQLRQAAIDDGKDPNRDFPVDAKITHRDRLGRVVELLKAACKDLTDYEEDNQQALGWRKRAIQEITDAGKFTLKAIHDNYREDRRPVNGTHPDYSKIMSDLRQARAFLRQKDRHDIPAADQDAIDAINHALDAARHAALEDGLDIYDNAPPDGTLPRADRLHKALEVLTEAHLPLLRVPESNPKARDWHRRAEKNTALAMETTKREIIELRRREDHERHEDRDERDRGDRRPE